MSYSLADTFWSSRLEFLEFMSTMVTDMVAFILSNRVLRINPSKPPYVFVSFPW